MIFNILLGFSVVVLYILVAICFVALSGLIKVVDAIVDAIGTDDEEHL